MEPFTLIGIDPDLNGGIAVGFIEDLEDEDSPEFWKLYPMPTDEDRISPSGVTNALVDATRQYAALRGEVMNTEERELFVFIEKASPQPHNGLASVAKTCTNYGILLGVFEAIGISLKWGDTHVVEVTPYTWKGKFGLNKDQREDDKDTYADGKEASRQLAIALFPEFEDSLARKKDHGLAEALLIALFGVESIRVDRG